MPHFKNDAWREALLLAENLRRAMGYIDDCLNVGLMLDEARFTKLASITYRLSQSLDRLDGAPNPEPLLAAHAAIKGAVYHDPNITPAVIRSKMSQALVVLDRMQWLGMVEDEPAKAKSASSSAAKRRCPRGQASDLILAALCEHHKYDDGSIGNWGPISVAALYRKLEGRVSTGTVSKWFGLVFGNHKGYVQACQRETLLPKLQSLRGEFNGFMDPDEFIEVIDRRGADPAHD